MFDYGSAKIYELYVDGVEMVYVGSTTQTFGQRLSKHKYDFKNDGLMLGQRLSKHKSDFKNDRLCSSKILFTLGEVQIRLIEDFPCASKTELERREGFWIKQRNCVNVQVAGQTKFEYYLANKDKFLEYHKDYRLENKDKFSKYRLENKDKLSKKAKEPMTCSCGSTFQKCVKARHERSVKHQTYLSTVL